jgi:TonB family protein
MALIASLLLHGVALAVAQLDRAETVTASSNSEFTTVRVEDPVPPEPPPQSHDEEIEAPLPPPLLDGEAFPQETPTPPPVHRDTRIATQSLVRQTAMPATGRPASTSARALAVSAPRPEYPYEARRAKVTGSGIALFSVDSATGQVREVTMSQSTGSVVLDQATIAGLRRWRFKPGTPARVSCPITFTLNGAAF